MYVAPKFSKEQSEFQLSHSSTEFRIFSIEWDNA